MRLETLLDNSATFWRGRVALYALLEAFGIGEDDEVILPGFTCVVVPSAIIFRGAIPIYVDIEAEDLLVSPEAVRAAIGERTRAIIVQNTFGRAPHTDAIMAIAEAHDLIVIEDCAHGLGGSNGGRLNGSTAHGTFFSSQWSKPISTGVGGIAFARDPEARARLMALAAKAERPGLSEELMIAAQLTAREILSSPKAYWLAQDTYRLLSQRLGLVLGSSSPEELASPKRPDGYLKAMGRVQRRVLKQRATKLPALNRRRTETSAYYERVLPELGFDCFSPAPEQGWLRFPVLVNDRAETLARAREQRVPLGDWFSSPLHPVESALEAWGYRPGQCPTAEAICARIVNLPTESRLDAEILRSVLV